MSALTESKFLKTREGTIDRLDVAASTTIYKGGLTSRDAAGNAVPTDTTDGTVFWGIALEEQDNSAGAAGAKTVLVKRGCEVFVVSSGLSVTNIGDATYATDDQTVSLTPNTVPVGPITEYVSATSCWVALPVSPTLYDATSGLLISPRIKTAILDENGLELAKLTATAAAVNEITLANGDTGSGPSIVATGGDTNVPITLAQKAASAVILGAASCTGVQLAADQPILDSAGLEQVKFVATGTAVNEITLTNAAAGNAPAISATGDDTNIDLTLAGKGSGAVTLTSPKVTTGINDANGAESIRLMATASAVNELTVSNAAVGNSVYLAATGDDTNVPITVAQKAAEAVILGVASCTGVKLGADQPIMDSAGNEIVKFAKAGTAVNEVTISNAATAAGPAITATGGDTNVPITLAQKGAADIVLGAATCTGVQLAANQSLLDDAGLELLDFIASGTAVNQLRIGNAATGKDPVMEARGGDANVGIDLKSKGTGFVALVADGDDAISVQKDTNVKIGFFATTPAVQQTAATTVAQTQQAITDSSGGAADTTIASITNSANAGSADVTPVANGFADIAAQLALIKTDVANLVAAVNLHKTALDNLGLTA